MEAVGPPPLGVVPNFQTTDTLSPTTLGVMMPAFALIIVCIFIRLFTKIYIMKLLMYEDYILTLSGCLGLSWIGILVWEPFRGAHVWDTPTTDLPNILFYGYVLELSWFIAMAFANWALLAQIQRVFVTAPYNATWWFIQAVLCISSMFFFSIFMLSLLSCNPRYKVWEPSTPGSCFNQNSLYLISASGNVAIVVLITIIPVYILFKVHMGKRKKVATIALFSLSLLTIVPSAVRLWYTLTLEYETDITRDRFGEAYCAGWEIAVLTTAATYPTMPRFVIWFKDAWKSGLSSSASATAENLSSGIEASGTHQRAVAAQRAVSSRKPPPAGDEEKGVVSRDMVLVRDTSRGQIDTQIMPTSRLEAACYWN